MNDESWMEIIVIYTLMDVLVCKNAIFGEESQ